jgi:hypothetical protein
MSARTLERWRWQKKGPAFLKLGSRVLYTIEAVLAYEAQHMHEPNGIIPDVNLMGHASNERG